MVYFFTVNEMSLMFFVDHFQQMLQTDWRRHFYNATAAYRRSRKTVYGLGTALSAPLILGRKLAIFT